MRPIDADKLLEYEIVLNENMGLKMVASQFITAAPTLDVAPVKHGKWVDGVDYYEPILMEPYEMVTHLICSNCNEIWFNPECHPNYCPHCGAKMDL